MRSVTSCSTAATSLGPSQQLHTGGSGGSGGGCCPHHRLWHLSHRHEEEEGDSRDLQSKPPGEGWGKSRDVECDQAATDGAADLSASHSRGGCASAKTTEHCRHPWSLSQASSSGCPCGPSSRQRELACLLLHWNTEGECSKGGMLHGLLLGIAEQQAKRHTAGMFPGLGTMQTLRWPLNSSGMREEGWVTTTAETFMHHTAPQSTWFILLQDWDMKELFIFFPVPGDVLQNSDIVFFWTATSCQGKWYRAMAQSAL